MKIWFEEITIGNPTRYEDLANSDARIYPWECRNSGGTYAAPLLVTICRILNDGQVEKRNINLGTVPIMVKSQHCHLNGMDPSELVSKNEDCCEVGGYFILNGLEKLLRLLIVPKRNYPYGVQRGTFHMRKKNFTNYAVAMKCVRDDLFSQTIMLNYTHEGNIYANVMIRKVEYLIPVVIIIKALGDITDLQLYNTIVRGSTENSFISERVEVLLRETQKRSLFTSAQCRAYLGFLLKSVIGVNNPDLNHEQIGEIFLREYIMVHCDNNVDKINAIVLMIQKLYKIVSGELEPDNLDSLCNQDILLSGHLYMMFFRERLEELLQGIKGKIYKNISVGKDLMKLRDISFIEKAIEGQAGLGKKIEYLLATGNLKSSSGLDLMQNSGYSIIAEKLNNMRFFSHLRSLHRGAYFTEMKTTQVRKLLPDCWGFVCPVHTPDGTLCGLLNHLSIGCRVQCDRIEMDASDEAGFVRLLSGLGMISCHTNLPPTVPSHCIQVIFNGRIMGYIDPSIAQDFANKLREIKVLQTSKFVHEFISITYIPPSPFPKSTQFPGIFLYTETGRPLRQVINLLHNKLEWIDALEQSYLSIACLPEDLRADVTHQETHPSVILSELATQIPFLQHNQSPRNM
jgi:DNA-directed RNA polymerase I subunit RPA2